MISNIERLSHRFVISLIILIANICIYPRLFLGTILLKVNPFHIPTVLNIVVFTPIVSCIIIFITDIKVYNNRWKIVSNILAYILIFLALLAFYMSLDVVSVQ